MQCPRCQHDNPADAEFCDECGNRLDTTCPGCGAPNRADAKFCRRCGRGLVEDTGAAPPATPASDVPPSYTPRHLAEKILRSRSVLVLSERLDPEEVHGLMTRVFDLILAEVHRYEGTVNQFLGDGVMALFGAPIAHEDHARRGVQAALGISKALGAYAEALDRDRGITFRVRQGLNTGLVVVGSIGSDLRSSAACCIRAATLVVSPTAV